MSSLFSLAKAAKTTRHSNAVAAGQTTITPSAGIDMLGFETCAFEILWGAITAGGAQSVKVQQSNDDGVADDYDDLEGSGQTVADDDDNKITIVEVVRPTKRYLKCLVLRATQDSAVDGIVAHQYGARTLPVTQDATTVSGTEVLVSPAEGTA